MGKPITPELIEAYAERCVEDMDMRALLLFAQSTIQDNLMDCTPEYIEETIRDYYPDLMED